MLLLPQLASGQPKYALLGTSNSVSQAYPPLFRLTFAAQLNYEQFCGAIHLESLLTALALFTALKALNVPVGNTQTNCRPKSPCHCASKKKSKKVGLCASSPHYCPHVLFFAPNPLSFPRYGLIQHVPSVKEEIERYGEEKEGAEPNCPRPVPSGSTNGHVLFCLPPPIHPFAA